MRVRIKMKTGTRVDRVLSEKQKTKYTTCRCVVSSHRLYVDPVQREDSVPLVQYDDGNWCPYCGLRKT